jgi:predicted ATPase
MLSIIQLFVGAALCAGSATVDGYISTRVNSENQESIRRYVLTGGPGVGKTTIANYLKEMEGCGSIDEAATRIMKKEISEGVERPWEDPRFTQKIIAVQRADREVVEDLYSDEDYLFFDRSPIDAFTYSLYHKETPDPDVIAEVAEMVHYFNPTVFLVENFGECEQTAVRPESIEEAQLIERTIEESYRSLGFEIVRVKPGTVAERAQAVLNVVHSSS